MGELRWGGQVCGPPLPSVLLQGLNPKKRHEVARLAALVAQLAQSVGATHVIDLGAGQVVWVG